MSPSKASGTFSPGKPPLPPQHQRMFKRGNGGDDVEEESLGPSVIAKKPIEPTPPASSGQPRQKDRFFKRGNAAYEGPESEGVELTYTMLISCSSEPC